MDVRKGVGQSVAAVLTGTMTAAAQSLWRAASQGSNRRGYSIIIIPAAGSCVRSPPVDSQYRPSMADHVHCFSVRCLCLLWLGSLAAAFAEAAWGRSNPA